MLLASLPVAVVASPPELDGPPERVITLAPNLTELIYALGEQDRLVAVIEHSNHPEAARHQPRVGDAFRLDFERIVALKPDLLIAWKSGNPEVALARLESLGLPVWRTEVGSPDSMTHLITSLGEVLEAEDSARRLAAQWQSRLDGIRSRYADRPPVRYLLQLNTNPIYTINDQQFMAQLLGSCGGENVFGELESLAPSVSEEAVLVADPDVILALDLPDALERWRRWPQMDAVANAHLYAVGDDALARPVPAALDALERVCQLLDRARTGEAETTTTY